MPSLMLVKRVLLWLLVIVCVAGGAAVTCVLVEWSQTGAPVTESRLKPMPMTTSADAIAYGTVSTAGLKPIPGSVVHLVIVNADGKEISRHQIPVSDSGNFSIPLSSIPVVSNVAAGMVVAQADSYLASKANVMLTAAQGGATTISPSRIQLFLQPYNSALVFILLLPAVFGLVMALVHLTDYSRTLRVSQTYAIGTACLWGFIVLWLLWLYASQRGRAALIPLFWDDLFISSGVVVFSFVGTMVYVAYSMHEKDAGFFEMSQRNQRRILLTLGGRVLVGPYVAVAAYGIMASTFPVLNTGAAAAFFGFFTGLWIKPVLEALNDIGLRLLSPESRQKVADRLTDQNFDAGSLPTSSANFVRADRAFLDAVAKAREELLALEGVIGVGPGEKVTNGLPTGRKAVVVYVYSKRDVSAEDPAAVPTAYRGFVTDVQTVPAPPVDGGCHEVMLDISPEKIYSDRARTEVAESVIIGVDGPVPFLIDPGKTLYFGPPDADNKRFAMIAAYRAIGGALKDEYDFVAFVLDDDLSAGEGYYYRPIFNDVRGTDFYWERGSASPFNVRNLWGTKSLRGAMVFSRSLLMKACLHEIGHAWGAYTRLNAPKTASSILDSKGQHWSRELDYGDSCMSNAFTVWQRRTDGTFVAGTPTRWMYSPLDRYLMGLGPLSDVSDLRLLRSQGTTALLSEQIPASMIETAHGKRSPGVVGATPTLRLVLIAVATSESNVAGLVSEVDAFRPELERAFGEACTIFDANGAPQRVLAHLSTARI